MTLTGLGIAKGMIETARNFLGSFVSDQRLVTVEYPEKKVTLAERFRNFPFLVFDGKTPEEGLRCTACTTCEKACPPGCITIVMQKDANGKPMKRPQVFDIDISVCMSCMICVEVCPFDAIKMDQDYEIAVTERRDSLLLDRDTLSKSNEYYHRIHPTDAKEVDDRLAAEKAEKAAKAAKAAIAKAAAASAENKPGAM